MDRHYWMYDIPRTTVEYWRGVKVFIKSAERFKKTRVKTRVYVFVETVRIFVAIVTVRW